MFMKKDILKSIKNDMWAVLACKKQAQQQLKMEVAKLEAERQQALASHKDVDDFGTRYWLDKMTNEAYDRQKTNVIQDVYDQWHNYQSYYLIYKDGSEVCISAEEIIAGMKFPKMSDIVYAEMSSADDHLDTESGELDWYSDERLEACGWDYAVEDERKFQYETAIQYKYKTEWARRWKESHPDFVPIKV